MTSHPLESPLQSDDQPSEDQPQSGTQSAATRIKRELRLAAIGLAVTLLAMPTLIYVVGRNLLGPYADGAHLGTFYGNFFRNLAAGISRTWILALAPYVLLSLLRIIFWRWGPAPKGPEDMDGNDSPDAGEPPVPDQIAHPPKNTERREPFIGS